MVKHTKKTQSTEMIRLPSDVVMALRHRAATAGITLGEAARQLILAEDLGGGRHGTIEHMAWLHNRLVKERTDLERVLDMGERDRTVVQSAIKSLAEFQDEWWRVGGAEADADVMKTYKDMKDRLQ